MNISIGVSSKHCKKEDDNGQYHKETLQQEQQQEQQQRAIELQQKLPKRKKNMKDKNQISQKQQQQQQQQQNNTNSQLCHLLNTFISIIVLGFTVPIFLTIQIPMNMTSSSVSVSSISKSILPSKQNDIDTRDVVSIVNTDLVTIETLYLINSNPISSSASTANTTSSQKEDNTSSVSFKSSSHNNLRHIPNSTQRETETTSTKNETPFNTSTISSSSSSNSNKQQRQQYEQNSITKHTMIHYSPKIYAIAYFLYNCNPYNAEYTYRHLLSNILINVYTMRTKYNSTADFYVYFHMSSSMNSATSSSNENEYYTTLPASDVSILENMNIYYRYLSQNNSNRTNNEHHRIIEQFRVLNLIQYQRVLVADSYTTINDQSYDVLLQASIDGTLQSNVMMTTTTNSDSNTNTIQPLFIVQPGINKWDHFLSIISTTSVQVQTFNDLLLYWMKYSEQSVSIITEKSIEHWNTILSSNNSTSDKDDDDDNDNHNESSEKHHLQATLYETIPLENNNSSNGLQSVIMSLLSSMTTYQTNIDRTKEWITTLQQIEIKYKFQYNETYFDTINKTERHVTLSYLPTRKDVDTTALLKLDDYQQQYYNITNDMKQPKFAYAYVIGGCNPNQPSYRSYIYDILINTYLQRFYGSTADVIVFFQMSSRTTSKQHSYTYNELPQQDIILLNKMNIQYRYIPKVDNESFYRTMLDKFRVLELTQYDRIMYLDCDILTFTNLDYLFEMSMNNTLQSNIVFTGSSEPANGGIFIVNPIEGDYQKILSIIQQKEIRSKLLPYPNWDVHYGWGHTHTGNGKTNDYIKTIKNHKSKLWDFHGAFADQGLLYYWVKFVQKDVSFINPSYVGNWDTTNEQNSDVDNETSVSLPRLRETNKIATIVHQSLYNVSRQFCYGSKLRSVCDTPIHKDFVHFTGKVKPWFRKPNMTITNVTMVTTATEYWWFILQKLDIILNIGIDYTNWNDQDRPLLGLYPKQIDQVHDVYRVVARKI